MTSNQSINVNNHNINESNSHLHALSLGSNHLNALHSNESPSSNYLLNEETPLDSFSQELNADVCLTTSVSNGLELYQMDATNGIANVQSIENESQPIGTCLLNADSGDLCWNSLLGDDIPLVESTTNYQMMNNPVSSSTSTSSNASCSSSTSTSANNAILSNSTSTIPVVTTSAQTKVVSPLVSDSITATILANNHASSNQRHSVSKSKSLGNNTNGKANLSTSTSSSCIAINNQLNSSNCESLSDQTNVSHTNSSPADWETPNANWNGYSNSVETTSIENSNSQPTFVSKTNNINNWNGNECKSSFESNSFDLDNFAELEQCTTNF